ncbi:AaceriACR292Wp [[Ashbya] aceris (nom. inval.)]|nr:AaceriACR292Wp [[Ashbya] aceris (nom. inval.)]
MRAEGNDMAETGRAVFSGADYYPAPSARVITYAAGGRGRQIMAADVTALVAALTSPVDGVEYELFADFFLVYRNFLEARRLLELLEARFEWSLGEIGAARVEARVVGEITLVRTFVLLRHWVINYFAQDFLPDVALRGRFLAFVNGLDGTAGGRRPKIVANIVVSLKKTWAYTVRLIWDDMDLEREFELRSTDAWLQFQIPDVTQLKTEEGLQRDSRLSFYARQSSTNPSFRNESVLSLYRPKDNFQLPVRNNDYNIKQGTRIKKRTASMFLYPQDSLNIPSGSQKPQCSLEPPFPGHSHARKISHISKVTNVSNVIKEVAYPTSPAVESFFPPTPSKKLEFTVNSTYVPPGTTECSREPSAQKKPRSPNGYRAVTGLLSKWRMNHLSRHKACDRTSTVEPAMDNLIKYVFSISSLESPKGDVQEEREISPSKFDILSARTIEEVEHLITVENEVLQKVAAHDGQGPITSSSAREARFPTSFTEVPLANAQEYSVIDNLNLYRTVSTIATSVIKLTRTASQRQTKVALPPVPPPLRQRPTSLSAFRGSSSRMLLSDSLRKDSYQNSKASLHLRPLASADENAEDPSVQVPNPPQVIFHTHALIKTPTDKVFDAKGVEDTSPKTSLVNTQVTDARPPSYESTITYDSDLQDITMRDYTSSNQTENHNDDTIDISQPMLNRKTNHSNLREFLFEASTSGSPATHIAQESNDEFTGRLGACPTVMRSISEPIPVAMKSNDDATSTKENAGFCMQTYDDNFNRNAVRPSLLSPAINIRGSSDTLHRKNVPAPISVPPNPVTKNASISPASGRISIIKKSGNRSSPSTRSPLLDTTSAFMEKTDSFAKQEASLNALENDLQAILITTGRRSSTFSKSETDSTIATNVLLASVQTSPQKNTHIMTDISEDDSASNTDAKPMEFSSIGIDSSVSNNSSFADALCEPVPRSSPSVNPYAGQCTTIEDRYKRSRFVSQQDSLLGYINENGNKYIFSPGDTAEEASPKKDMETLKTKFMNTEEPPMCPLDNDTDLALIISKLKETNPSAENIDIENTNDDPTNLTPPATSTTTNENPSDPVAVALMKLEGTFAKPTKEETSASKLNSPCSSMLAKEVEKLDFQKWRFPSSKTVNKRQSMFIERRRTMTDIFSSATDDTSSEEQSPKLSDREIRELLETYKLQDPRLNIKNVEHHVPFILMYDSCSIAKQMTLIEREVMNEIDWKDLLDLNMKKSLPRVTSWLQLLLHNEELSGIDLAIARFNLTVDWIISELVMTTDIKLRRNAIQRLIHVAEHCRIFQNYNTVMEIVLALNSVVVQKFTSSWRLIEPADMLTWEHLKSIPSLDRNYYNVRNLLNSIDPIKGCIPFLVVYLSDLALNSEKRDWIVPNEIVNYNKFQTNVQIVKNFIQRVQWARFYDIRPDENLLSKCVYISALSHEEIGYLTSV